MLKMFLCESHMIFLSRLGEHCVANVVHKVLSNCEEKIMFSLLVLLSVVSSYSESKHCSTMFPLQGFLYQGHLFTLHQNLIWFRRFLKNKGSLYVCVYICMHYYKIFCLKAHIPKT